MNNPDNTKEPTERPIVERVTRVVHCKRERYDVYIGRPSKWGNPFTIGKDGTRAQVIERYEEYLLGSPDLMAALPELMGRVLGCWCAPKPCHGDILARYADPTILNMIRTRLGEIESLYITLEIPYSGGKSE